MVDKEQCRSKIRELVERYDDVGSEGKLSKFSEADVGSKFILPLLKALGWDITNIDEVREQTVTLTGPVDYSLNLNKRPKIFLELKKFDESLDGKRMVRGKEETHAEQAIRYAWHMKVDWVVLTNFGETRLYYSHVRKPQQGLVFQLTCDKYIENIDRLWILARDSVVTGVLDQQEKRRDRKDINEAVLDDLLACRKLLTESLRKNHPELSVDNVRESVQRILDRILVIRVAEDRNVIGADSIWKEQETWRARGLPTPLMRSLKSLFRDFDEVYDSRLFETDPCEDLRIDNETLEELVQRLYRYNFDLISSDVLGAIYEDYIGHVLEARGKGIEIVPTLQTRRSSGIYYTPQQIVEYIVRTTLDKIIREIEKPEQISRIRVLDPAVGSGSFLIKAFDVLKEWYDKYSMKVSAQYLGSPIFKNSQGVVLFGDVGTRILTENLFGIDVDAQAAEIASVNLMLKALEKGKKLPKVMGQNIRVADSLVSCLPAGIEKYHLKPQVIPIAWETDFKSVFRDGGFDVVIGNPPWGADLSQIQSYVEGNFDIARGQYDSYELFLELSKRVLRDRGIWGFVIPDSIFRPEHKRLREFLCKNYQLEKIVKLGEGFFESVFAASVIIVFRKEVPNPEHEVTCLTLMKEDREKVRGTGEVDLQMLEQEKGIKIQQRQFMEDPEYSFDITLTKIDTRIMNKMESCSIDWHDLFDTWRGVEFSERGVVIQCPNCFNWDSPPLKRKGEYELKVCKHCGHKYAFDQALARETIVTDSIRNVNSRPFIPGKGVNRYHVSEKKFIDISKKGINYKDPSIYDGDKLIVRKTGVGIYATIDSSGGYVPQVVFIFKLRPYPPERDRQYSLEYLLGVLNSRLMLYYYYKKFGELEWKSFPYMSQKTFQTLPIHAIDFSNKNEAGLHNEISIRVKEALRQKKPLEKGLDYEIEDRVMALYGITPEEKTHVWQELDKVQKLRIIRETMGTESEEE